jgi:hypothetical protein
MASSIWLMNALLAPSRSLSFAEAAALPLTSIDAGVLKSTMAQHMGRMTVENLRRAHQAVETNRTTGKVVLGGF